MLQEIKYKGITRLPSDHDTFDGEMEEMYNLANSNGELRPVLPPDVIGTMPGQFIFVHKNQGYEHFIALDGADIKAYNYNGSSITLIGTITNIYGETIIDVKSVGNTLVFITDLEVKYALWSGSSYKYLGWSIPFPVINLSLSKEWSTFSPKDMSKYGTVINQLFSGTTVTDEVMFSNFTNEYWAYVNKNYTDTISSGYLAFPFFVRYAIRLYDGSLIKHSMPFLMLPNYNSLWNYYMQISDAHQMTEAISRSRLFASWTAQNLTNWVDIISSIDIFISSDIWLYPQDAKLQFSQITGGDIPSSLTEPKKIQPFPHDNNVSRIANSLGNLYFLKSITLSELNATASNVVIDTKNLMNVLNQEPMVDDYYSHDKITSESGFVYNNKLHLSGIKRSKFPGFKLGSNRTYYSDSSAAATIGIGDQPFVFYPGKASKLYIDVYNGTQYRTKEIPLIQHPRLNGSYYIDPDLKNIINDAPLNNSTPFDVIVSFGIQNSSILELNKLYVSAHQNPFLFPVESRITLPVGKIIAIASNTQAISQGQFGQFPLYVFTDDGIWALEVSTEGKYVARQPVSREVCINPQIMQMDSHIAFITAKGLCVLSGTDVECISDIISDNNTRASKLNITSFINATSAASLQQVYQTDNIETFLQGCVLAYEYLNGNGRIFVINGSYSYAYVFDILSKTWGKVKSDYSNAVPNYPDCYVQASDGKVRNLSTISSSTSDVNTLFISRPITMEDALFTIKSFRHNGILKSPLNTVIYGSRNGVDYTPIKSSNSLLMHSKGSPFRYFKIAVIADLKPSDVISGCSMNLEPKFTNRLR